MVKILRFAHTPPSTAAGGFSGPMRKDSA